MARWQAGHSGGERCIGGGDRYDGGVLSTWGAAAVAGRRGGAVVASGGRKAVAARDHSGSNKVAAGGTQRHVMAGRDGNIAAAVVR